MRFSIIDGLGGPILSIGDFIVNNRTSQKERLRKQFTSLRNNVSEVDSLSAKASEVFFENIEIRNDSIISAYYPIKNEISPIPILGNLHNREIVTCLPVIGGEGRPLIFRKWNAGDSLNSSSSFGLQEPADSSPVLLPSIIIVPLLAFDNNGYRMGYGGGYYDRTISDLRGLGHKFITIGLAYSLQESDALPKEEFDQKLDYVVTEKDFFDFT